MPNVWRTLKTAEKEVSFNDGRKDPARDILKEQAHGNLRYGYCKANSDLKFLFEKYEESQKY